MKKVVFRLFSSLFFFSFPLFSSNFFVCLSPLHLHRRQHDMFNFLGRLGLPSVHSRSFLPSSFVLSVFLSVCLSLYLITMTFRYQGKQQREMTSIIFILQSVYPSVCVSAAKESHPPVILDFLSARHILLLSSFAKKKMRFRFSHSCFFRFQICILCPFFASVLEHFRLPLHLAQAFLMEIGFLNKIHKFKFQFR